MNVRFQRGETGGPGRASGAARCVRAARSIAAFTMVEIAICLAVIAFALVAIIGILPVGMNVQRDNREQTLINFDAAFLMDTLRSGAQGQNSLTNYIIAITNVQALYDTSGALVSGPVTNWFTTNQTCVNGTVQPFSILTNGFNIIGILSTPRYIPTNNSQYYSNAVWADFIAFSGNAVDQGRSQVSKDFAFSYRVFVEFGRAADYPYDPLALVGTNGAAHTNWVNLTAPGAGGAVVPDFLGHADSRGIAQNLQANAYELRLRVRWPILPNGKTGGGSVVFRSSAAGQRDTADANLPGGGLSYYHLKPLSFAAPQ